MEAGKTKLFKINIITYSKAETDPVLLELILHLHLTNFTNSVYRP